MNGSAENGMRNDGDYDIAVHDFLANKPSGRMNMVATKNTKAST